MRSGAAAHRAADAGAGDVSLPVGLHVQGGRDRAGRDRSGADLSTCFGAPFMPRRPEVYGRMLQEQIAGHGATCWLVNTGWTGGAYGTGRRMPIAATRTLLSAALDGSLVEGRSARTRTLALMCLWTVPGVDGTLLDPRGPGRMARPTMPRRRDWYRCLPIISSSICPSSMRTCGLCRSATCVTGRGRRDRDEAVGT